MDEVLLDPRVEHGELRALLAVQLPLVLRRAIPLELCLPLTALLEAQVATGLRVVDRDPLILGERAPAVVADVGVAGVAAEHEVPAAAALVPAEVDAERAVVVAEATRALRGVGQLVLDAVLDAAGIGHLPLHRARRRRGMSSTGRGEHGEEGNECEGEATDGHGDSWWSGGGVPRPYARAGGPSVPGVTAVVSRVRLVLKSGGWLERARRSRAGRRPRTPAARTSGSPRRGRPRCAARRSRGAGTCRRPACARSTRRPADGSRA